MRRPHGFTLMEALIVIMIIGALAAFGFPAMTKFLQTQAVRSASYDLFADLIFARSEAIARGVNVTFTSNNGTDWKGGWTINATGAADNPIRVQSPQSDQIVMTGSVSTFSFERTGRADNTVTVSIVPVDATTQTYMKRCIRLDPSGRPKSAEGACP